MNGLEAASALFRASGEKWQELSERIASAPDEAVAHACRLANRRTEALDERRMAALEKVLAEESPACALDPKAARTLYAQVAGTLEEILGIETQATACLADIG